MADSRRKVFARRILMATMTAFLLGFDVVASLMIPVQSAFAADLAAAKATVDAAKAGGIVGEQADGYLGFVHGSADAATTAAVEAINAGRKQAYDTTAAKTGVGPEAVGEATAKQLFVNMPQGQYHKSIGGDWTKK